MTKIDQINFSALFFICIFPSMKVKVRKALIEDLATIQGILHRSLYEVCAPAYKNNKEVLDLWASRRTPEHIKPWIEDPTCYFVVAQNGKDDQIVGVGLLQNLNIIKLCYVLPEALGTGIGSLILKNLENQALLQGAQKIFLSSTLNAVSFYEKHSYINEGEERALDKIPFVKMSKVLTKSG